MSEVAARVPSMSSVQRRTVSVLVVAQVLGGVGTGAAVSTGALLVTEVSGDEAWSGMSSTMLTLGAALAAVPLASLANRFGRRVALASGAGVAFAGAVGTIVAAASGVFPLLLVALAMLGFGNAVGLQARFAATDLASARHRGRTLSLVVWCTTIGAVAGPNLLGVGGAIGAVFGLSPLVGPFLFTVVAQLIASILYLVALRPDPLLLSRTLEIQQTQPDTPAPERDTPGAPATFAELRTDADGGAGARQRIPALAVFGIAAMASAHAVMVGVMAMTPVHLEHQAVALPLIGLTISLHVAGMFGFSPVFGVLADRLGGVPTVLIGAVVILAGLAFSSFGAESPMLVAAGLILLGLGWSACTVAGSALVARAATGDGRTRVQGRADLVMNLTGAAAGAVAGPLLALLGYAGLGAVAAVIALALAAASAIRLGRRPVVA